jgi:hypothetical protein
LAKLHCAACKPLLTGDSLNDKNSIKGPRRRLQNYLKIPTTEKIMKTKLLVALVATICFFSLASAPGFAHHGTGNSYDSTKWATVTGTVTEYQWKNPHSSLFLDVKDDKGAILHYSIEMNSPGVLVRQGWTRHTISVGDTFTAIVHPSLAGAPIGQCYSCKLLVNGKEAPNEDQYDRRSSGGK